MLEKWTALCCLFALVRRTGCRVTRSISAERSSLHLSSDRSVGQIICLELFAVSGTVSTKGDVLRSSRLASTQRRFFLFSVSASNKQNLNFIKFLSIYFYNFSLWSKFTDTHLSYLITRFTLIVTMVLICSQLAACRYYLVLNFVSIYTIFSVNVLK